MAISSDLRPKPITTAVIPVAGGQAAFLPATKVLPRELLPIVDTPLVQLAVDEARAAGVTRFIFVERSGDSVLRRHFAPDPHAERRFSDVSADAAARARAAGIEDGAALFVQQDAGPGLGRAIASAAPHLDNEPFAVILPDDVIAAETPVLAQMTARYETLGGAMIAGIEVPRAEIARYGIMKIADTGGDVVQVTGLEEKPAGATMRSNFAIAGRYILPPQIFSALENTAADDRGAVQLTDAIALLIGALAVNGIRFSGERFDCGEPAGLIRANIHFALQRPDLRLEVLAQLRRSFERADRDAEKEARKPYFRGRRDEGDRRR